MAFETSPVNTENGDYEGNSLLAPRKIKLVKEQVFREHDDFFTLLLGAIDHRGNGIMAGSSY